MALRINVYPPDNIPLAPTPGGTSPTFSSNRSFATCALIVFVFAAVLIMKWKETLLHSALVAMMFQDLETEGIWLNKGQDI